MRIWLTELAEPLPFTPGRRLLRVGLLAERLAQAGHDVTWWTSAFDHVAKTQRCETDRTEILAANYRIHLLHAPGYRTNGSLARVLHHRRIARAFARRAPHDPSPDLVYCCVPTLEVTDAALRFAAARDVPMVVDVRDLWPDAFLGAVPTLLRPFARIALVGEVRRARRILRRAAAILAVSEGYLRWALAYAGRARRAADGVFPHGYPTDALPVEEVAQARRRLEAAGVDPGRCICSFVGTFGRTYDLAPVMATAARLWRAGEARVQFVFAGEGERGAAWRALAEGLKNVVFTGWLSSAEIAALVGMSSIGLAAYADGAPQGLPNKIFEFLSGGLPILSSLRGETEALLAESGCGLTYAAGDADAFAARLAVLVDAPDLRRDMAARARAKFDADFRADRVYPALVGHLEMLVARRPVWA